MRLHDVLDYQARERPTAEFAVYGDQRRRSHRVLLRSTGGFEHPRSVDVMVELPRNPSGKVLKRVLRESYWTGHQRRVGGV